MRRAMAGDITRQGRSERGGFSGENRSSVAASFSRNERNETERTQRFISAKPDRSSLDHQTVLFVNGKV
jgi:hypothetical protein